ncbi:MAG: ATP-dependent RecD-like DNA helicase [Oscillospiraceae bacterium]|nr:ATP-dependent RecD-like DNA helicase [Oscillospiraceae bacterium]
MEARELLQLNCTVTGVIFFNEENGYTVLRAETDDGEEVTVTGCLPYAAPGEQLALSGTWGHHSSYGKQFQAEYANRRMPEGAEAIYQYLAGRVIKGVGPATASLLVTRFGADTLDVIENHPEKLVGIRGMSMKKAVQMSEELKKQVNLRYLMEFLSAHGIKPSHAMRLYAWRGEQALEAVRQNPYILCQPQIGGQFAEADALALALDYDGDSPERICAAIIFELRHNTGNGHVFIPRDKLIAATAQLISLEPEAIAEGLQALLDSGEVIMDEAAGLQCYYLEDMHRAEDYTATRLLEMSALKAPLSVDTDAVIAEIEHEMRLCYAPMQRRTLEMAAEYRVLVITGGPGTGKTTVVRAIIAMYEKLGLRVQLAAPTGRAAKRMTELTGVEAATIHRLLEAQRTEDGQRTRFARGEDNPLKCGALIMDESSMVDITLMHALLCALPRTCRLVMVGDADQLPSVGAGNVFADIIRSNVIPVVRLVDIFRQNGDSRIVLNAHKINEGVYPDFTENKGDFFFLRRTRQEQAAATAVELCARRLPNNMGIPAAEIQVLTPTRRGECGSIELNKLLQNALNPAAEGKKEKNFASVTFRVGDRVMQIRNNYDILWETADKSTAGAGAYNGDIGYITDIDANRETLTVNFDGRLTVYDFEQLGELEHAWAMTVHKSQGSEYRAVVICLCGGPPQLLYRGVLYTAVTRARELLVITGDDATARRMIDDYRQTRRYSGLRWRLAEGALKR